MFYHISMQQTIILHPRYFGADLLDRLRAKLRCDLEGSCTGTYGFVIAITSIDEIGSGILMPNEGFVQFPMKCKGIVFRPFKGEILDGIVKQVNKVGIFVDVGPLSCFISHLSLPMELKYCLVDKQPCYRTDEEDMVIMEDAKIRFKLIGTRIEVKGFFGVGTLAEDYLGVIE